MKKKTKRALEKALAALESTKTTYELMINDPPWSGNSVMEGTVKGMWTNTPGQVDEAIKEVKSILSDE